MILAWLIALPLAAGALAWLVAGTSTAAARWLSLGALAAELALVLGFWLGTPSDLQPNALLAELELPWIPRFGISLHLAMDGLSFVLVALTLFLGLIGVACSWTEIDRDVGFFHASLLWSVAGVLGVFLALDLFLFFFFWEVMLVPMYFLIAIWGHEHRIYSAIKFFIFTQASSLLMLASIVGLAYLHFTSTGDWSFDYFDLLGLPLAADVGLLLMLGFFIAFAVKLPVVPLHTWLPDAHTDAPTAGSVLLAGVLLKTGAYGLIRFVVPLFPEAAASFAPVAMTLAVLGILYGAVLAFAQTDFKRLVAYTSVSHLGFVLLGVFAWNEAALQGAVMQMVAHGLATGGLFVIAGALQERLHSRDMRQMGGLWTELPRMGAVALFFAIAALGLPGLGTFVGEFLVLLGAFAADRTYAVLAALGMIAAAVYALALIQRSFHGRLEHELDVRDFGPREIAYTAAMVVGLFWLGVRPHTVLDVTRPALLALEPAPGTLDERAEPAAREGASEPQLAAPARRSDAERGIAVARGAEAAR